MPHGRICPGCHAIVFGPCPNGCRPGGKKPTARRQHNQKVWSSSAHRLQRLRVIKRDDYTCQRCDHRDDTETGKGLVADHVRGIDAVRQYDDDELQTLCRHCSGKKAAAGLG